MKKITLSSILFFIFFFSLHLPYCAPLPTCSQERNFERDNFIPPLSSLIFCIQERGKNLILSEDVFFSSEDETEALWEKLQTRIADCAGQFLFMQPEILLASAYTDYQEAMLYLKTHHEKEARIHFRRSVNTLNQLWKDANEERETINVEYLSLMMRSKKDPNFEINPFLPTKARELMKPYLLPLKHPQRDFLDSIFQKNRATTNENSFHKAGFKIICKRPRSYICVAEHPKMPGYLVKAYMDTELNKKFNKESWEWLVLRCKGAKKVKEVIEDYDIKHFVVPDKWIYCLPAEPSPPENKFYTRHLALLLVRRMKLTSEKRNLQAWKHEITKEHLNELFEIISRAKGSSYRPDNIAYLKNGQFAFIDTEYPGYGPDFKSIRGYLNTEMRNYWDKIVKNGGYDF